MCCIDHNTPDAENQSEVVMIRTEAKMLRMAALTLITAAGLGACVACRAESLRINIVPPAAGDLGAKWKIVQDGVDPKWRPSGEVVDKVSPGAVRVELYDPANGCSPKSPSMDVPVEPGQTKSEVAEYTGNACPTMMLKK